MSKCKTCDDIIKDRNVQALYCTGCNADKKKENQNAWYSRNKNNIFKCECGGTCQVNHINRHFKTLKHLVFTKKIHDVNLFICECGLSCRLINKDRHMLSLKHINLVKK